MKYVGVSVYGGKVYGTLIIEPYREGSLLLDGMFISSDNELIRVLPQTVKRFTGLYDRRGTSICEDNVVTINDPNELDSEEEKLLLKRIFGKTVFLREKFIGKTFIVKYLKNEFYLVSLLNNIGIIPLKVVYPCELEVIKKTNE